MTNKYDSFNNIQRLELAFELINDHLYGGLLSLPAFSITDDIDHYSYFEFKKFNHKGIMLDHMCFHSDYLYDSKTVLKNLLHECQHSFDSMVRKDAPVHGTMFQSALRSRGLISNGNGHDQIIHGSPFHSLVVQLVDRELWSMAGV